MKKKVFKIKLFKKDIINFNKIIISFSKKKRVLYKFIRNSWEIMNLFYLKCF